MDSVSDVSRRRNISSVKRPAVLKQDANSQTPRTRPRRKRRANFVLVLLAVVGIFTGIRLSGFFKVAPPRLASEFTGPALSWEDQIWPDAPEDQYLIGVGKADITGPVVEVNLMGYAEPTQLGTGLRQRLYSRAFVVGSLTNPRDRFVYLVLDTQAGDTAIRYGILEGLEKLGHSYSMYGHDGLAVTGTHSHSGPAGWNNYLLPQLPSMGFSRQSYQAIVDGCLLSIRRAHESLRPGYLNLGTAKLSSASINRSLFSYMANPSSERAKYNVSSEDDGSVDTKMTMLKFQRASDGLNIGMLNWFPTHGTSMFGNNTLITGDNKGVAADLFEKKVRGRDMESDGFVAGFSQANMGDVSPRVLGAWCEDGSGDKCSFDKSTCSDGRVNKCHARGPIFQEKDGGAASCYEIGRRQYEGALELYDSMKKRPSKLRGKAVKSVHVFHNMAFFNFNTTIGRQLQTCPAAMGYSFAAGTSDGPGALEFTQHGSNASNTSPFWKVISRLLKKPTEEQVQCQHPKPILLDVGEVHKPYAWAPNIVDVQLLRVGNLVIVVSPSEATTMAGRRWREAVAEASEGAFGDEIGGDGSPTVVLGGPGNSYAHYVCTEEEYMMQRFEAASTLYGPHTLAGYIERSIALVPFLKGVNTPKKPDLLDGPMPPDNSNRSLSLIAGVVWDHHPWGQFFGHVKEDVAKPHYWPGDAPSAVFVGANPRNNLRLEQTFAAVEYHDPGTQSWQVAKDDSDWDLIFHWRRTSKILGTSEVEIVWEIPDGTRPGHYRLRYFGDAKSFLGKVTAFNGTSSNFSVTGK